MPQNNNAEPTIDSHSMQSNAREAALLLKTIGNEYRLSILCILLDGERSVGELNQQLELSQSSLSQHLAVLRDQGLVTTRREAQTIYYQAANSDALKIVEVLHEIYCQNVASTCQTA